MVMSSIIRWRSGLTVTGSVMEASTGSGETTPKSSDAAPHRRNLRDNRAAAPCRESGLEAMGGATRPVPSLPQSAMEHLYGTQHRCEQMFDSARSRRDPGRRDRDGPGELVGRRPRPRRGAPAVEEAARRSARPAAIAASLASGGRTKRAPDPADRRSL